MNLFLLLLPLACWMLSSPEMVEHWYFERSPPIKKGTSKLRLTHLEIVESIA